MMAPRKNATNRRGRPFQPGNGGRPKGARNRVTLAVETILQGEAEGLTRTAIRLAQAGDTTALRLCIDRVAPARKERPISLDLPRMKGPEDSLAALAMVIEAVGRGEVTPGEATAVTGLLAAYNEAWEYAQLEARVAALEARV